jgi:hypothetical protein
MRLGSYRILGGNGMSSEPVPGVFKVFLPFHYFPAKISVMMVKV